MWPHLPDVSPSRFLFKHSPWKGDGEDSVTAPQRVAAAATWWSLVLLSDESPSYWRPPNLGGAGAKHPLYPQPAPPQQLEETEVTFDISQVLSFPLRFSDISRSAESEIQIGVCCAMGLCEVDIPCRLQGVGHIHGGLMWGCPSLGAAIPHYLSVCCPLQGEKSSRLSLSFIKKTLKQTVYFQDRFLP